VEIDDCIQVGLTYITGTHAGGTPGRCGKPFIRLLYRSLILPGMSYLDGLSHSRDMSSPASSKRVCAKYERGECDGSCCPYFHPKDLVSHLWAAPRRLLIIAVQAADKPTQPAQEEAAPAATKQAEEPAPNPTEPTPGLAPQSPMDDTESVCSFLSILAPCCSLYRSLCPFQRLNGSSCKELEQSPYSRFYPPADPSRPLHAGNISQKQQT